MILGANLLDGDDRYLQARSILQGLPFVVAGVNETVGTVFKPFSGTSPDNDSPLSLPLSLGDVSVEFNHIPAPIFSIAKMDRQEAVTLQVPFEAPVGPSTVTVHAGKRTATAQALILPATPGIFEIQRPDSTRQAIILRDDGSLVDLQHPARRGESLRCLATGLGPISATGAVVHSMAVGIHHAGVPLLYARSAPGMVGVEEIGFEVPTSVARSGQAEPFASPYR